MEVGFLNRMLKKGLEQNMVFFPFLLPEAEMHFMETPA